MAFPAILLPLLAGTAKGAAITGGATAAVTGVGRGIYEVLPENIREGLNLTPEKVAENETYDLDKGKFTSGGIDDFFRDLVTGQGDKVREVTEQNALDKINKLSPEVTNAYDELPLGEGFVKPKFRQPGYGDETTEQFKARKQSFAKKLGLIQSIDQYGGDVSKLTRTTSVPELNKTLVETKEKYQKDKDLSDPTSALSMTLRNQEQQRLDREYQDRILQYNENRDQARLEFQTQQTNLRNAHNAKESNKRLAYEREATNANRQQTMQLALMDREDRRIDRRIAREDRAADKRQQSIMLLMKGLTQLGAGFSI